MGILWVLHSLTLSPGETVTSYSLGIYTDCGFIQTVDLYSTGDLYRGEGVIAQLIVIVPPQICKR